VTLDNQTLIELYTTMLTIRRFEERVATEFYAGNIVGFIHSYIGQEGYRNGSVQALSLGDRLVSHHRGQCTARQGRDMKRNDGGDPGKKTGYCKAKGGSMHIADFSNRHAGGRREAARGNDPYQHLRRSNTDSTHALSISATGPAARILRL